MNKLIKKILIFALLCAAIGCLFACATAPTVYAPTSLDLILGDEYNLGAVVVPFGGNEQIIFFSDNPDIAQIDQTGKITAKNRGVATISSKIKGSTAITKVTVYVPASDITVDETALFVAIDDTAELRAEQPVPEYAVAIVDWQIENTAVAKIIVVGEKYMIKGLTLGATKMTGTDIRTQKTATYPICVIESEVLITLEHFTLDKFYVDDKNTEYPLGALGCSFDPDEYYVLTALLEDDYKATLDDLNAIESESGNYWYLITDHEKTQSIRADKFGMIFYIDNGTNDEKWAKIRVFKHSPIDDEISTAYYLPQEVNVFYATKDHSSSSYITIGVSYKTEEELLNILDATYDEQDNTDPEKPVFYFTENNIKYKVEINFDYKRGLTFLESVITRI